MTAPPSSSPPPSLSLAFLFFMFAFTIAVPLTMIVLVFLRPHLPMESWWARWLVLLPLFCGLLTGVRAGRAARAGLSLGRGLRYAFALARLRLPEPQG